MEEKKMFGLEKKKRCPSCGSKKIREENKEFRKGMLLLGVIGAIAETIRSKQTQFVCDKCGYTWEEK
jgi:predicted RNA-binding Zn-ribbon protein involved in translation (DUF1610 family)